MMNGATRAMLALALGSACVAGLAAVAQEPPPPPETARFGVIDPDAAESRTVLVLYEGRVYRAAIIPGAGAGPPAPAPSGDGTATDLGPLAKAARRYLRQMPVQHREIAKAIRAGTVKTETEAGKMAMHLRDQTGDELGRQLNDRISKSGTVDESGRITDPAKLAGIFDNIADQFDAVLKP